MQAYLKNYRQSPRKVRLVANLIKGKKVDVAEIELAFASKRAALAVKKLLDSAATNAKQNFNIEKENLYVKEVRVDKGVTLHRWRARARGAAFPINKRSSNITLILAEQELKDKKTEKPRNIETKVEKTAKAVKRPKEVVKKVSEKTKAKEKTEAKTKVAKKVKPKAKK